MDVYKIRYAIQRILLHESLSHHPCGPLSRNINSIGSLGCHLKVVINSRYSHQQAKAYHRSNDGTDHDVYDKTILGAYEQQLSSNIIRKDEHQYKIVEALQQLDDQLKSYTPPEDSLWDRILSRRSTIEKPKGLYLWGSVGCGKTYLMDLFYENCSVNEANKKRVHFHRFMLDVHAEIHQIKLGKTAKYRALDQRNPIPSVAKLIAARSWLLCLDEFQVTDVADAMILKQLFTHLFEDGVILLATSNRVPDDLYKSGLQRSAFLPFIPMLKSNCNVKCLDSNIDYRKQSDRIKKVYFVTNEQSGSDNIDSLFKLLSLAENDIVGPQVLLVNQRRVKLSKVCGGIADCDFSELCMEALGADDYDRMGKLFHTVIVRNIPQLTLKMKSEARRFITFIDMMYDNRIRVVFSAQVELDRLFNFDASKEFGSDENNEDDSSRILLDDLGLSSNEGNKLSFITGEDEVFAFSRAVSRITEMQSEQYWESVDSAPPGNGSS